jgi:hypothetical protein
MDITEISKTLKSEGIFTKENWLNENDQKKIATTIQNLKPAKEDSNSFFITNYKIFLMKIFKFNFKNVLTSIYYQKLSKKLKLIEIAKEFFETEVRLTRIDHYWTSKSEKPVIQWHVDNAYSGRKKVNKFYKPDENALKFIFYLNDVSSDNGCLSYIPKSQKIAYALKQGIYKGEIEYQSYWTLFDFRKIITKQNNFNYLKKIVGEKLLLEFLNTSESILNKTLDKKIFDKSVNKGGAVIFDEAGVHMGSKTMLSDRMVLRFFYKKKF